MREQLNQLGVVWAGRHGNKATVARQCQTVYLRCSICLRTVASGRQGAALSQALGRIANHWLLLFLVGGIVVVVATVSLVVHHLTVGHVGESRVLHGGGVGQSPTIMRGVRLKRRKYTTIRDLYIQTKRYLEKNVVDRYYIIQLNE